MISDVLSEAVNAIDQYLENPTYFDTYVGELRARIVSVRDQIDALRRELDTPPERGGE